MNWLRHARTLNLQYCEKSMILFFKTWKPIMELWILKNPLHQSLQAALVERGLWYCTLSRLQWARLAEWERLMIAWQYHPLMGLELSWWILGLDWNLYITLTHPGGGTQPLTDTYYPFICGWTGSIVERHLPVHFHTELNP